MPARLLAFDRRERFAAQLAEKVSADGRRHVFEHVDGAIRGKRLDVVGENGMKQCSLAFFADACRIERFKPGGKPHLFHEAVSKQGYGAFGVFSVVGADGDQTGKIHGDPLFASCRFFPMLSFVASPPVDPRYALSIRSAAVHALAFRRLRPCVGRAAQARQLPVRRVFGRLRRSRFSARSGRFSACRLAFVCVLWRGYVCRRISGNAEVTKGAGVLFAGKTMVEFTAKRAMPNIPKASDRHV